jgi:hypothetical protein
VGFIKKAKKGGLVSVHDPNAVLDAPAPEALSVSPQSS